MPLPPGGQWSVSLQTFEWDGDDAGLFNGCFGTAMGWTTGGLGLRKGHQGSQLSELNRSEGVQAYRGGGVGNVSTRALGCPRLRMPSMCDLSTLSALGFGVSPETMSPIKAGPVHPVPH